MHYQLGTRVYAGDLVFDRQSPILVVSWRTIDYRRVPYITFALDATRLKRHSKTPSEYVYDGELLRTGNMSAPAPWDAPRAG